jgi:hypothetical protein
MERAGATTLKGNPLTLVGPELKAAIPLRISPWWTEGSRPSP